MGILSLSLFLLEMFTQKREPKILEDRRSSLVLSLAGEARGCAGGPRDRQDPARPGDAPDRAHRAAPRLPGARHHRATG